MKPNIIFFNSFCNLDCNYCYEELNTVNSKEISFEELDKIISSSKENEEEIFVLFGGEPTLSWNKVKYFMDEISLRNKKAHFNIITNGIKFLESDFLKDYVNLIHLKEGRISLDISFDGMGNNERIYRGGKSSTPDVIGVLSILSFKKIDYRIRYTINRSNFSDFERDIISIMDSFSPKRIILNTVSEISKETKEIVDKGKEELVKKWNNQEIKIPICDYFCNTCNGCSDLSKLENGATLFAPNKEKEEAKDKFDSFDKILNSSKILKNKYK